MIKAAVFDFDGTIMDTEKPAYLTWCEIFARFEVDLPLDAWIGCIGGGIPFDPVAYLQERTHRPVDRSGLEQERNRIYLERVNAEPLRSDILSCLLDAKRLGLKIGLASSSLRKWVTTLLEQHGLLSLFDVVRTRDDVSKVKPDPELYQAVITAFGIRGEEGIAFEDSRNGLLSAKAAGLYCVVSPCELTKHLDYSEADIVLSTGVDHDLQTLIAKFNSGFPSAS